MKGNFHVQFLGEGVAATSPPYPTLGWATTQVYPARITGESAPPDVRHDEPPIVQHPAAPTPAGAAGQSLKEIATAVGAVAAVAYGAGYIVTTMHLYWWFIYNPTLVNGRYVSVGFCFLWIAAVTLLPAYYLIPSLGTRIRQYHGLRQYLYDLLVLVLSVVGLILLSAVLIGILSAPPVFAWGTLKEMAYTGWSLIAYQPLDMLVGWYGFLLATGFLLRAVVTGGLPRTRVGDVPNSVWADGIIVLLLVLATYRYAISIYPLIIPAVGGGQEVLVQLLFDGKDSDYMRTLVPVEAPAIPGSRPTRSEQVELLEQTDKTYIVLVGFDLRLMPPMNDVSGIPTEGLIPKSGWFSPRWRPEEARFSRENEGFPQWSFHPDSTQHLKIGCPILIVVNASRFKARVYVCVAIAAFWDRAPPQRARI